MSDRHLRAVPDPPRLDGKPRSEQDVLKLEARIRQMRSDTDMARAAKACAYVRAACNLLEEMQVSPGATHVANVLLHGAAALAAFEPGDPSLKGV